MGLLRSLDPPRCHRSRRFSDLPYLLVRQPRHRSKSTLTLTFHSCITARRRKRAGLNPYRGTGWAAGQTPFGHGPAQYTGGPAQQPYFQPQSNNGYGTEQHQNPPVYSPPQYGGQNQGYFGGQQSGIELQQPPNAYQSQSGGQPVYDAPQGPPPGKKFGDGVVR